MSLSNFLENELVDAAMGNGSYNSVGVFVSLHSADPGETGANEFVGGSYARDGVTMGAASGGSSSNTTQVDFTNLPAATATHVGFWDAASGGNFLGGGALTQSRVYAGGEDDSFPVGALTFSLE